MAKNDDIRNPPTAGSDDALFAAWISYQAAINFYAALPDRIDDQTYAAFIKQIEASTAIIENSCANSPAEIAIKLRHLLAKQHDIDEQHRFFVFARPEETPEFCDDGYIFLWRLIGDCERMTTNIRATIGSGPPSLCLVGQGPSQGPACSGATRSEGGWTVP